MRLSPNKKIRQVTKNLKIRNGLAGNMDTVSVMQTLARLRSKEPSIRAAALSIFRSYGVKSHDYLNECRAIGEFIKRNVRYVRDIENVERIQDPLLMLQDLNNGTAAGDCDDMALMIATLLLSVGAQPYFRVVRYQGNHGPYAHIYVVCYDRNGRGTSQRIVLDAIVKDKPIGYEVPHSSGEDIRA